VKETVISRILSLTSINIREPYTSISMHSYFLFSRLFMPKCKQRLITVDYNYLRWYFSAFRLNACINSLICPFKLIYIYIYKIFFHMYMRIYIYMCMYIYIYIYIYICIYLFTHYTLTLYTFSVSSYLKLNEVCSLSFTTFVEGLRESSLASAR